MISFKQYCLLLLEERQLRYDDRHLLEMANVQPKISGLKPIIFVSYKGSAKHGPRVKVSNIVGTFHPEDNFTITLEPNPVVKGNVKIKKSDLNDVIDWVKLNRDHLLKIWFHGDTMTGSEIDDGFIKL